MPLSTVILAIVCVVLAGLLALSIAGRHQAASGGRYLNGLRVAQSVRHRRTAARCRRRGRHVRRCLGAAAGRSRQQPGLGHRDGCAGHDRRRHRGETRQGPAGRRCPAYTRLTDRSLHVDQQLADGSTVQLQLVFDQAAIYGWLVSSVQLG